MLVQVINVFNLYEHASLARATRVANSFCPHSGFRSSVGEEVTPDIEIGSLLLVSTYNIN